MNEKKIYDYLVKSGLTPAGACGLMGNLYAESGLISNRVEILCLTRLKERGKIYTDATYTAFVDDGTISKEEFLHPLPYRQYGYGLAQWTTPDRKSGLYDLVKSKNVSIGYLDTQLEFLVKELKEIFRTVYSTLTTTTDVLEATTIVLKKFEAPADTSTGVVNQRFKFALNYYSQFAKTPVTAETILKIFRSWIGKNEYDGSFKSIIDLYNSYKPLARGYKVTYRDAWCDATVSAAFIQADAVHLIGGTECGVQEHVVKFIKAGIWKGRIQPQVGDIIVYDWTGDGYADHIGIVDQINGTMITTIEGNYQDSVKRRYLHYGRSDVMGYARPSYSQDKKDETATQSAEKFDKTLAGTYQCKADVNMRNGAGSSKYSVMVMLPKGTKVQNYGYYSLNGKYKWLYVQVTLNGIKYTGFCSAGSLKKC